MEKMREEFEKCWLECGDCEVDDIYSTNEYEVFKFAWKASRTAQCVELPSKINDQSDKWSNGYDFGIDDAQDALDAAGVSYK